MAREIKKVARLFGADLGGRVDLRPAGIRGNDRIEEFRNSHRGLPGACRTVPGAAPAAQRGEVLEQLTGILRPMPGVARGLRGEMVFETRPCRHYMLQLGVLPACCASL